MKGIKRKMKVKNIFKIGIFLLGISLILWNCEQNEFLLESTHSHNKVNRISFAKFSKSIKHNSQYEDLKNYFDSSIKNRNVSGKSNNDITILTDEIVHILNGNISNYTFKIVTESEENQFFNLVIQVNQDNEIISSKVYQYIPDQSWLSDISKPYSGYVKISKDKNISLEGLFQRNSRFCLTGVTGEWVCNLGNNHYEGHPDCTEGTSWEYIIRPEYERCDDNNLDQEDEGIYTDPNDTGGTGGNNSNTDDDNSTSTVPITPCEQQGLGGQTVGITNGDGECINDCPEGYTKNPETGECDPICNGGKKYNTTTKKCECPEGQKEDDSGNCVDDCDTSKEDLKKIFPNLSDSNAELLASVINQKGRDFGIDTKEKLQHFLAQAGHETGGFNTLNVTESTYWTTASKLAKTYKKFTMDSTIAANNTNKYYAPDYLRNSSGVANVAMCCKYGNGNVSSGDGYKYRGRGLFQLTWKNNYSSFKTWYNNKYNPDIDPVSTPSIIATNDTLSILSGLWYYKTRVLDKITVDSTTSVSKVTKPINAAKKGLKDRKSRFQKAKDSIKCL